MKKAECIERYGEEEWGRRLEQGREYREDHKEEREGKRQAYYKEHGEEIKARIKEYKESHPEQEKAKEHEQNRKGGKYYDKHLAYVQTGIPGERHRIRNKHNKKYKQYKAIIAPDSQLHHEWVPTTADYRGVALVEEDQHQYGIINVIQILDGEITLVSEEEIKKRYQRGKKGL